MAWKSSLVTNTILACSKWEGVWRRVLDSPFLPELLLNSFLSACRFSQDRDVLRFLHRELKWCEAWSDLHSRVVVAMAVEMPFSFLLFC